MDSLANKYVKTRFDMHGVVMLLGKSGVGPAEQTPALPWQMAGTAGIDVP